MSALLPCSAHLLHLYYSAVPRAALLRCRCTCCVFSHWMCVCAMTEEFITCDLTCSSPSADSEETLKLVKTADMECEQPIFSVLSDGVKQQKEAGDTSTSTTTNNTATDAESGIFSGECELCVEHETELDWFCGTELKLICSHCAIVGPCHGHTVTPLATRVTAVRVRSSLCAVFICNSCLLFFFLVLTSCGLKLVV